MIYSRTLLRRLCVWPCGGWSGCAAGSSWTGDTSYSGLIWHWVIPGGPQLVLEMTLLLPHWSRRKVRPSSNIVRYVYHHHVSVWPVHQAAGEEDRALPGWLLGGGGGIGVQHPAQALHCRWLSRQVNIREAGREQFFNMEKTFKELLGRRILFKIHLMWNNT